MRTNLEPLAAEGLTRRSHPWDKAPACAHLIAQYHLPAKDHEHAIGRSTLLIYGEARWP
jgi:hypothetical protein